MLKDAVVAAEDKRFWEHKGVDARGVLRAAWTDYKEGETVQGGSTITQQYVKNAYLTGDRTLSRKLREAILATQLERRMSKEDILFNYLNTVYFGSGAYGVGAAAAVLLRQAGQPAHAVRVGHAGRPDPGADRLLAPGQLAGGRAPPPGRARRDARGRS